MLVETMSRPYPAPRFRERRRTIHKQSPRRRLAKMPVTTNIGSAASDAKKPSITNLRGVEPFESGSPRTISGSNAKGDQAIIEASILKVNRKLRNLPRRREQRHHRQPDQHS
jgi:hypothetical protein